MLQIECMCNGGHDRRIKHFAPLPKEALLLETCFGRRTTIDIYLGFLEDACTTMQLMSCVEVVDD